MLKPAPTEDHNPITDLHGLFLIVGDEDRGDVEFPLQANEPFAQLLANLGIDRSEGFVEQEDFRIDGHRTCEGRALPHAMRKLTGERISELAQSDFLQERLRAAISFLTRSATHFETE